MKKGRGGIEYEDIALGDGPVAGRGCVVQIRYDLFLNQGDQIQAGHVCSLTIGERSVIPGLEYGVEGMRLCGKRRVRIPPHLGYGAQGVPGLVPPNAVLVFHITLAGIDSKMCASL